MSLADPLPLVYELADRLRASLGALIDPPIPGLEIGAVGDGDSGAGYLVIGIPRSSTGPHGFSRPPQVFVRRDDRSEPATMRDILNSFWETRSNRERIEQELARLALRLNEMSEGDLCFQFAVVSEQPIQSSSGSCISESRSKNCGSFSFRFSAQRRLPSSSFLSAGILVVPRTAYFTD